MKSMVEHHSHQAFQDEFYFIDRGLKSFIRHYTCVMVYHRSFKFIRTGSFRVYVTNGRDISCAFVYDIIRPTGLGA